MISIQDIQYSIRQKNLLKDISLEIGKAEILAIIGPNGAGKSTLLKTISGEISPDSGSVCMNDEDITNIALQQQAQLRAVVKQSNHVLFPFSVYDIVSFGRYPINKGIPDAHDEIIIRSTMEKLDLEKISNQVYSTLSGGEMQRVQLARAIVQIDHGDDLENKLLLLDEPLSNMDIKHQHHCLSLLNELSAKGCTIVIVLHDLNLATVYCSQIALLNAGELRYHGAASNFNDIELINRIYGIDMEIIKHPSRDQFLINPIV